MGASALYLVPPARQQAGAFTVTTPMILVAPPLAVAVGAKVLFGLPCAQAALLGILTAPLSIGALWLVLAMTVAPR